MKPERSLVILEKEGGIELQVADEATVYKGDRMTDVTLEDYAQHDNPQTRAYVARAIPSFLTERTRDLLDELAEDEDEDVRLQANASKELLK